MTTLAFVLTALSVGVLLAALLDATRRRDPRRRGGVRGTTPRPGGRPPVLPAEVVALRLTASGLVWLNPQTGSLVAFSGPQGKGAARRARDRKRAEADERNARTLPENRRAARRAS